MIGPAFTTTSSLRTQSPIRPETATRSSVMAESDSLVIPNFHVRRASRSLEKTSHTSRRWRSVLRAHSNTPTTRARIASIMATVILVGVASRICRYHGNFLPWFRPAGGERQKQERSRGTPAGGAVIVLASGGPTRLQRVEIDCRSNSGGTLQSLCRLSKYMWCHVMVTLGRASCDEASSKAGGPLSVRGWINLTRF